MSSAIVEKSVFVFEKTASDGKTLYRGTGQLIESVFVVHLKTDLVLIDELGRKFYILQAGDEDGTIEKIEFSLLSKAGIQVPHDYIIKLESKKQSFPPSKGSVRLDPASGLIFWEEEGSTSDASH